MINLKKIFASKSKTLINNDLVIKEGEYIVEIIESYIKSSEDESTQFIIFKFKITQGECIDNCIYTKLLVDHSSFEVVKKGKYELEEIRRACGYHQDYELIHLGSLHNIPIKVGVDLIGVRANMSGYNRIRNYKKI